MFTLPISESQAIAIDDTDELTWPVHIVDFEARTINSFDVEGEGTVQAALFDATRGLVWVVSHGALFALELAEKELLGAPQPPQDFFIYAIVGDADQVLVGGEYQNLWQFTWADKKWRAILEPAPKPPEADDPEVQTERVREYARANPPFYAGFKSGDEFVFCGALGTLVRVRDGNVLRAEIDSGARLVSGHTEGNKIMISADSPGAEIYRGNFVDAFELYFADKQPALHRNAKHGGERFIGIAEYPPCDLHNLYVFEAGELIPYNTGCAREPEPLISLTTVGESLWAIDLAGIFRRKSDRWQFLGLQDLQRGSWPDRPEPV